MEKTVDAIIAANSDTESLRTAFNERFGTKLTSRDFQVEVQTDAKDMRIVMQAASRRAGPRKCSWTAPAKCCARS